MLLFKKIKVKVLELFFKKKKKKNVHHIIFIDCLNCEMRNEFTHTYIVLFQVISVAFELIGIDLALLIVVNILGHLPHLHDVVLRHRAYHPGLVGIP